MAINDWIIELYHLIFDKRVGFALALIFIVLAKNG